MNQSKISSDKVYEEGIYIEKLMVDEIFVMRMASKNKAEIMGLEKKLDNQVTKIGL